jgi:hypothetical protein
MFYFVMQTLFLVLLIFTMGLFVGIFLKHLWCKQRLQRAKSVNDMLKAKGRGHISRRRAKHKEANARVRASFSVKVKSSESAALAKKRTTALVEGRRRAAREAVVSTL